MAAPEEYREFFVDKVIVSRPKAFLFEIAGEPHWVPRFAIAEDLEEELTGLMGLTIHVKSDIAFKNGLIQ